MRVDRQVYIDLAERFFYRVMLVLMAAVIVECGVSFLDVRVANRFSLQLGLGRAFLEWRLTAVLIL